MGLYSGGFIIGRLCASEIWRAYFREGLLLLLLLIFFFFWGGGGLIIEILRIKPGSEILSEFYGMVNLQIACKQDSCAGTVPEYYP